MIFSTLVWHTAKILLEKLEHSYLLELAFGLELVLVSFWNGIRTFVVV